jgi:hypothetical protein
MTSNESFPAVTAWQTVSWLGRNAAKPNALFRSSGRVVKLEKSLRVGRSDELEVLTESGTVAR